MPVTLSVWAGDDVNSTFRPTGLPGAFVGGGMVRNSTMSPGEAFIDFVELDLWVGSYPSSRITGVPADVTFDVDVDVSD